MTLWFADASVLLARFDDQDPEYRATTLFLGGSDPIATLDLAYYEVTNVAIRSWHDPEAARKLRGLVTAIGSYGGLVRVDEALAFAAAELAERFGLSAYDAAYLAAVTAAGAQLVSCDLKDLVGPGLAISPTQAAQAPPHHAV